MVERSDRSILTIGEWGSFFRTRNNIRKRCNQQPGEIVFLLSGGKTKFFARDGPDKALTNSSYRAAPEIAACARSLKN